MPSSKATTSTKQYRPAVITFMDILGFKNVINNLTPEEIYDAVKLVAEYSSPKTDVFDGEEDFEKTVAVAFSDSVIRVRHFDTAHPSGALFHEILALVHAQAELADKGILVRGGLTVGNVFIKGTTIFGPGFVRAYELESEFANYPRIIVDPEAFNALRNDSRLVSEYNDADHDIHYIRKKVRLGDDGLWYIDYLSGIISELDEIEYFLKFLRKHKNLIVKNAQGSHRNFRILQKYLWLAQYHNSVCTAYNQLDQIIDQSEISVLEPLPDNSGIDPDA